MKIMKRLCTMAVAMLMMTAGSQLANASLITNGTFDTDLSGWTIVAPDTTTGVSWISGTAHVGRPGTPGLAVFEQSFDIPMGTSQLAIEFDYEWQVNQPVLEDFFKVELSYESTSGTVTETLLDMGSNSATFSPPAIEFDTLLNLINLDNVADNGTIRFTLSENNTSAGTRIELDNVDVSAVPEASAIAVWSALTGLCVMVGRRRKTA